MEDKNMPTENPNAFEVDTGAPYNPGAAGDTSAEDTSTNDESTPVDEEIEPDEFTLAPEFEGVPVTSAEDAPDSPYDDNVELQDNLEGLGAPGDAPRTPNEAIAYARRQINENHDDGYGYCLQHVRTYYGVGALYGDAWTAWEMAETKHHVTDPKAVPRGVPVFWKGGSQGYGHIALSIGDGKCISTDWASDGRQGVANINDISYRWNQEFVGYAREVNEVVVWTPGKPQDKPKPPTHANLKKAIAALKRARDVAKREHHTRRAHILTVHIRSIRELMDKNFRNDPINK